VIGSSNWPGFELRSKTATAACSLKSGSLSICTGWIVLFEPFNRLTVRNPSRKLSSVSPPVKIGRCCTKKTAKTHNLFTVSQLAGVTKCHFVLMRSGCDTHATCFSHQLPHLPGLDASQFANPFEPAPVVVERDFEDAQSHRPGRHCSLLAGALRHIISWLFPTLRSAPSTPACPPSGYSAVPGEDDGGAKNRRCRSRRRGHSGTQ
jgi:hypothetical protein